MILHQEVIGQFYCKLLLSSEIAKAEAISVKLVEQKMSELKCLGHEIFFFPYLFSLLQVQMNSDRKKIKKKIETRFFSGPKEFIFCLKSVPQSGKELAGDDVEN